MLPTSTSHCGADTTVKDGSMKSDVAVALFVVWNSQPMRGVAAVCGFLLLVWGVWPALPAILNIGGGK